MNEFIEQFLIEARELVEQATHDLLALEAAPDDRAALDSAFRAFHTLKGSAGIIDFAAMARALHAAEDVLAQVRGGSGRVTPTLVENGLSTLDQVVQWLDAIDATGEPPPDADIGADAIVARFSPAAEVTAPAKAAPDTVESIEDPAGFAAIGRELLQAQILMLQAACAEDLIGRLNSAARIAAHVVRQGGRADEVDQIDQARTQALAAADPAALITALHVVLEPSKDAIAPAEPTASTQELAVRGLRVDVERIDALVRLTGELTVIKNALGHLSALAESGADLKSIAAALKDRHAQFDRLTGELQHAVVNIRVLSLRQVFQRFPRLVRDLGASLGKSIRLVTEGDDTEADKAVVESLFEPLLHVVRNAIDHGLEPADARFAAGKSPMGVLRLTAVRRGEHVLVEVEDDGAGVNLDRVREVAAARGVASSGELAEMTDAQLADLVFAPGFSTAEAVSDVSGRGVGMDAVRAAVERMGGRVTLESRPGQGTVVRFTLPFTVMMSQVMTVEVGDQVFGIPLDAVVETVRVTRGAISPIGAARAFVLRDRTLPLFDLAEALGRSPSDTTSPEATIVVASVLGQRIGLEVDRLGGQMDVMLKPMDGLLRGTAGVSGATLLGDGRVLVVLDLQDLLSSARLGQTGQVQSRRPNRR